MKWWTVRLLSVVCTVGLMLALSLAIDKNMDDYVFQVLIQCGVFILLAVSLNLINGVTGQFSIGHAGFYAIGAYTGAAWTRYGSRLLAHRFPVLHLGGAAGDFTNLLIAIVLSAAAAALAGLLVGLPSLRLRGDYLAIVTLGFGEVIRVVLLNIDEVGGARGMNGIPELTKHYGLAVFWVYGAIILALAISKNLMQSVRGLTWLAVREDEVAADAMGVNTTRVKVSAFVIGSMFAGIAGVLYAHCIGQITPDLFGMDTSIIITTMVVLGGTGSMSGAVVAAALLTALPEVLRSLKDYRMVIFSTLLVIMMLTRPQGIFGTREIGFATFGLRNRRRPNGGGPTPAEGGAA